MTTFGAIQNFIASVGPYFLRNRYIGTFLESVAITHDQNLQSLDFGLRLSQPLRCDPSALPVLSHDRRLRLYPTESEQSKRHRLTQWNQLARQAGTHIGELRNAQPYFLPDVPLMRIVHQDGLGASATWHTLDTNGNYSRHKQTPSNWNWDNTPSKWSRWWVICFAPAYLCTLPRYGQGHRYGQDGLRYSGTLASQVAHDLIDMVLEVKAAHSGLRGYIIATDPNSFDPTSAPADSGLGWTSLPAGDWAQPLNAAGKRTRPPSAVWIYDRRSL